MSLNLTVGHLAYMAFSVTQDRRWSATPSVPFLETGHFEAQKGPLTDNQNRGKILTPALERPTPYACVLARHCCSRCSLNRFIQIYI